MDPVEPRIKTRRLLPLGLIVVASLILLWLGFAWARNSSGEQPNESLPEVTQDIVFEEDQAGDQLGSGNIKGEQQTDYDGAAGELAAAGAGGWVSVCLLLMGVTYLVVRFLVVRLRHSSVSR